MLLLLFLAAWSLSMRAYLSSVTVKMRLIDASYRAASLVPATETHWVREDRQETHRVLPSRGRGISKTAR